MDKRMYFCAQCGNPLPIGRITTGLFKCQKCNQHWTKDYLEEKGFYDDVYLNPDQDLVNHPNHYISKDGIESIDVIRAFTRDLKGMEAVCTANILKYVMRWNNKNGIEDLKKARWYLDYLITEIEVEDD